MPLGERAGDKSEFRYCGVETEINDDMPHVLAFNLSSGGLNVVVAPLMDLAYRLGLMQKDSLRSGVLPFAGSDLVLSPYRWRSHKLGFAGYFDATLYRDVHLGTEPSTVTPNMFSWFSIFFPLRTPACIGYGSTLEVNFWRCFDPAKVWYEWCVASPSPAPIHNSNGCSYWVGL